MTLRDLIKETEAQAQAIEQEDNEERNGGKRERRQ